MREVCLPSDDAGHQVVGMALYFTIKDLTPEY
jgi:hypothetical protein